MAIDDSCDINLANLPSMLNRRSSFLGKSRPDEIDGITKNLHESEASETAVARASTGPWVGPWDGWTIDSGRKPKAGETAARPVRIVVK